MSLLLTSCPFYTAGAVPEFYPLKNQLLTIYRLIFCSVQVLHF